MRNIVFLYTEIAPYFLACAKALASDYQANVHIVRYPVNNEAPFLFENKNVGVTLYDRRNYNRTELQGLVRSISPSVILCSGWIDSDYLAICKHFFGKVPAVLTMDTHWRGDLKQQLARLAGRFYLRQRFNYAWVPGEPQKKYARKLGFGEEQISLGFYSCDTDYFSSLYEQTKEEKEKHFPKRFIYVGRYYDFKGLPLLWKAFAELQQESPNDWELWCLGTGTLEPFHHPKIKHLGFVQPAEMLPYIKDTSVFVMPSLFEPWGVVLHEFATMRYPAVVSDRVGAAGRFVKEGINGFIYPANSSSALKEKLKTIMQISPEKLTLMGEESRKMALQITPRTWAAAVMRFV
jgi:glycosyltransferase involved in cell wall biosynthesis